MSGGLEKEGRGALRSLLLSVFEAAERGSERLPAPVREALGRELGPVRDLFLRERPVRLCLVADDAAPLRPLLSELLLAPMGEAFERAFRVGGWTRLGRRGREAEVVIVRASEPEGVRRAELAMEAGGPDVMILAGCRRTQARVIAGAAAALCPFLRETRAAAPVVAVWVTEEGEPGDPAGEAVGAIGEHGGLARRFAGIHPVRLTFRLRQDGLLENPAGRSRRDPSLELLLWTLFSECPAEARVSVARATFSLYGRKRLAETLTRAASAVAGVIGAQPLPLADMPLLTTLQLGLVAGIARVSGRRLDARLLAEITAAGGYNIAAAAVFRGVARVGVRLLPGWGNVVSAGIAAAGTTAVGRAAAEFLIEDAAPGAIRG